MDVGLLQHINGADFQQLLRALIFSLLLQVTQPWMLKGSWIHSLFFCVIKTDGSSELMEAAYRSFQKPLQYKCPVMLYKNKIKSISINALSLSIIRDE